MKKFDQIILFFFIIVLGSCATDSSSSGELSILEKKFGGNWSLSSKEGCVLMTVINSKRINSFPDSLDYYLDEIEALTVDFRPGECLDLELKSSVKQGNVDIVHSNIYTIRQSK